MRWVRRVLIVAVLLAFMVTGWRFAADNQQPVSVDYLAGEIVDVSLWKVICGSFAAGAALVAVFALLSSARNGIVSRRYRKAIGGLEAEVHQLRNLPLAPDSEARAVHAGAARAEGAPGRNG